MGLLSGADTRSQSKQWKSEYLPGSDHVILLRSSRNQVPARPTYSCHVFPEIEVRRDIVLGSARDLPAPPYLPMGQEKSDWSTTLFLCSYMQLNVLTCRSTLA
jgi:hypothetical protein